MIRTAEGVEFSLLLAGPLTRFIAAMIDLAVIMALGSFLEALAQMLSVVSVDLFIATRTIAFFSLMMAYGIVLEWLWRGQTVGKRVMKLRVMDEQGLRLQFNQIAIRNLLRIVDQLPVLYLVGGMACLISRRCQRLGDFAANTIVVRAPKIEDPDFATLGEVRYNSLRDHPHLEARLRQYVSPEEIQIAVNALMRRKEMEPEDRVELFEDIADHFRALAQFPEEATIGVTDEQYVRNVLDSLFQRAKRS